jgi:poly(A) polymerase
VPTSRSIQTRQTICRCWSGSTDHGIDPKLVDERAINVVRTLKQAGFEAYIVGGAVRDLLVGLRPKDFDVATNATPEQVKGLFRRAFIIGGAFASCTWCTARARA